MNKQNILLNYEQFKDTYQNKNMAQPFNHLFPIKNDIAKEYAYLVGKIMGDGHLDSRYTTKFIGQLEDLKLLKEFIIKIFNISTDKTCIYEKYGKGKSYLLQINAAYFGRILFLLGAPKGNKTKQKFLVPNWVMKNRQCKKQFLQALLEDELTTIKVEKCNYSVSPRLKMAKKPLLI